MGVGMGMGITKMPEERLRDDSRLEIRVLGPIEVVRNVHAQPLPPSRKTRALLAYLALSSRPCRREDLCELLWESTADPRGELRWSLSRLRAALGPWLVVARDSISIGGPGLTVDVMEFRRLGGAEPSLSDARTALRLWRGGPLADVDVEACHRYRVWWLMEREALTELHRRFHHASVDRAWSVPAEALAAARELIADYPYDEWGHARVAQALRRAGRATDARDYVEKTRRTIARDLDTPPCAILSVIPSEPRVTAAQLGGPAPRARRTPPSIAVWSPHVYSGDDALQAIGAFVRAGLEDGLWRGRVCDVIDPDSSALGAEPMAVASYAVHGGLTRFADGLRLSLRCISARRNVVIWHARFGPERETAVRIDDWVCNAVGGIQSAVQAALMHDALATRDDERGINDQLMAALALCHATERTANARALSILRELLDDERDEPRALALAAWSHGQRSVYNWSANPDADRRNAERYASVATRLGANDPTCLTIIGAARSVVAEQKSAHLLLNRALELDPAASWAHARSGWVANYMDEPDRAVGEFHAAMRLGPRDGATFNSMVGLGVAHFIKGEHEPAIAWMEKGLAINPRATWVHRNLVPAYVAAGRDADAHKGITTLISEDRALSVAAVREAMVFTRPTMARISEGLYRAGLSRA
jgi:DNA-binding SARP family transcriptional activator